MKLSVLLLLLPAAAMAQTTDYNNCYGQWCECWGEPANASDNYGAAYTCANPNYDPPAESLGDPPSSVAAPEIDPAGAFGALTLLAGGLAILRRRGVR